MNTASVRCGNVRVRRAGGLLTWGQDGPEPDKVGVVGGRVVPIRRPAEDRVVVTTAAPKHMGQAILTRRPTRVDLRGTRIISIPIPTPLPHIPRHVIQPIPVRRKITHRTRVGITSSSKRRIIADGSGKVVGVTTRSQRQGITVVVRLAPRNGVRSEE